MDGPRAPQESEFPRVVQFLDSHLRPDQGWSIASEYPTAFTTANLNNLRIITEQDQVVAHALTRPMIIKTPVGLFKIAGLGSVVTSTDHRNQGHSTRIIESCLEGALAHGCDFAILWTSLYDFYRKIGFELGGSEVSVLIDRDFLLSPDGAAGIAAGAATAQPFAHTTASTESTQKVAGETSLKFMDSNKVAAEPIHRLYSQHTVSSLRTLEETRKYLQIPNSRVYTAWDDKGTLRAYAIEGKGADLNGYIHEWGGGVSALMSLFAHIRKIQARSITVIVPKHSQNLLRAFKSQNMRIHEGYLGMIKILNTENLFSKIKRHARFLGVADLVLEHRDGKYFLGTGESIFVTDNERDVVKLLFGPHKASEIHNFGSETSALLEKVLPIDMWVWGWDSV